jgi:hypothetical protein
LRVAEPGPDLLCKARVALLVGLGLVACSPAGLGASTTQPTPANSAVAALNTVPLKLPPVEPGRSCSPSKLSQVEPHLGMGLGSGPVYLLSGEIARSDPRHSNKVVWAAGSSYTGPIRIRGGRLDGTSQVLFDSYDNQWRGAPVKTVEGTGLAPELDLLASHSTFPNEPPGWRMWPSGMYLATPGCYAWQVDGLGFTEIITFHSLDLSTLPAGAACPVSPQQVAHDLSTEFGYGPAVGVGPIYALMGEMQAGVLRYSASTSGWAYSKVLWMAKPEVDGRVVIRGVQIDGQDWIGFGMGASPEFALQWQVTSGPGWSSLASEVRLLAPGCYAFQVDGPQGSEVIAFQVVGIP